jgi:hypothetical protein
MSTLAAATEASAGGAALDQLAIVAGATSLVTLLTVALIVAYRRGGARVLRRVEGGLERALGVPGWAALPGAGAVACAVITILGATWDIGLHIDVGRDVGPLGTLAHYPLLLGLFGAFLMGLLAVGMAPTDPRRSSAVAFHIRGVGWAPAASVLLLAGASLGMGAFPLDDLWHRVFGQDVTLWGPTHVMIIGGTLTVGVGGVLLLAEGARAAGREPFRGRPSLHRPLAALLAGVFLYLWAATLHEFNWGVPQYRQIWHPLLLAFGGAQALVLARQLGGRGGTFAALATWLPLQVGMTLAIGGPLEVTAPSLPLFVVEALIVEAVALRRDPRGVGFGAVAGAAVGTLGLAANYAWSHLAMPLPWESTLLPEAVPVALIAGVAGGVLGALMAQALTGTLPPGRRALATAVMAGAAFIGLGVNAAIARAPEGVTATMAVTNVRAGPAPGDDRPQRVADLAVRLSRPRVADDAQWAYVLGWQGGGRFLAPLTRRGDGAWHATKPVPVGGRWKTFVRLHAGRTMLTAPVRMPPDPAIAFAGFPARPRVTRPMVADTELLQIERRRDAPMFLWTPATLLVLSSVLAILVLMAVVSVRLGRMVPRPAGMAPPHERTLAGADRAPARVERRGREPAGAGA